MASQPIVLTSDEITIQQAALQEAQLQKALGEIKAEKERMIRRRARMHRRQADVGELEEMDLTHMSDDVKTMRYVLLNVVEMQDHQTTLLQDIQQSLALLVGRAQATPSMSGPGAWPVVQPPPFVPPVTGVSPYTAPTSVQTVSLGMPLAGGFSAGPSLQVPVQTVFSQTSSQVAVSGQPAVSQPAQQQGTQPQQSVQQPAPQGPQLGVMQGPGQSRWVPKTTIAAPKPFTGDKRGEDLDTWLRAVSVYVKCKLTLPHEEVLVAASYLEGSAVRWLSGLVQLQGYGHDFRAWAAHQKLEDFLKMVEDKWHDPQEAQKATDVILTLHTRQFKSVREAIDVAERLICVPGVRYDPQVLLTSYLRCFPMPLWNQLADEANINMHNFPSFNKKALDLEAKIWHGHNPMTDGKKKTLPPNWKSKGRIMFVDNDGSTIELDDEFQAGSWYGLYEFVVMPFGFCNAPGTFQHAMNRIFHDYLDKFVIVYLDDILIFSKTVEEHVAHLDKVLSLLRQHKFKINGEKCEFGRTRVLYLGHEIFAEGLKPDDAKVASICDWPRPQSVTEMRSFLGMTGYYCNFVQNYSIVVALLTDLTRLDTPWEWTDRHGESLSMDFMDMLVTSKSGMRHIFVIVHRFSKYARLVAMPETAKTEHVIKLFKENWVRYFGLPKSIVSDRDVRFTNELWKAAAAEQGTQLQMTSGNHLEANGQAEQLNRAVQHLQRHYIKPNQVDWDEKFALIASLYNNAVHSATGVSPNSLLLTFKPRLPLDFLLPENQPSAAPGTLEFAYRYEQLMQQAVEQMHKTQAAMIESENKHRRPSTFQVGERVWVKSSEQGQEHGISRKLMPQYFGPWEILDVVGNEPDGPSYVIRIPGHLRTYPVFHASKLAPFKEADQFPSRRSMLPPTMDGEVDIDNIVDHREMPVPRPIGRGRPPKPKLQYRVRFRHHFDPKEDRWFTREELMQTAPQCHIWEEERKDWRTSEEMESTLQGRMKRRQRVRDLREAISPQWVDLLKQDDITVGQWVKLKGNKAPETLYRVEHALADGNLQVTEWLVEEVGSAREEEEYSVSRGVGGGLSGDSEWEGFEERIHFVKCSSSSVTRFVITVAIINSIIITIIFMFSIEVERTWQRECRATEGQRGAAASTSAVAAAVAAFLTSSSSLCESLLEREAL
ncbi:hypothetical protein CBR_g32319 [Chara braunii]|uniref:Integrase catalytic domain-containing protein n=1 Tax=Chara braunii TaxID=69332 RepID=A0A388JNB7_CHABU|nr:hypothetical protein CBR_g32319 [Chara braunii]|eukprot:GBG59306.1 hypothetical protein CBR_g32319 [Chara braunii]